MSRSTVNAPFPDPRLRLRADTYARTVVERASSVGVDLASAEHDIADAFVVGFEAGRDSIDARRTVRK